MLILNLLIIVILGLIAYQDFRFRAIHWALFFVLFLLCIITGFLSSEIIHFLQGCVFNFMFLLIQFILLLVYYSIKGISMKSVLNVFIGFGDLVFLGCIVFAFSKINFIVFYLTGMIVSLLIWLVSQFFSDNKEKLVPLAGLISSYMIIIISADIFFRQFERISDSFLINLVYG